MKILRMSILKNITLVFVSTSIFGCELQRETQDTAVLSCLSSLHKAVASSEMSYLTLKDNIGLEWKILDDQESNQVISIASRNKLSDCFSRNPDGVFRDKWNGSFQIAVRRKPDGVLEFILWSKGSDGISGTSDDIVSPYGAKVPETH